MGKLESEESLRFGARSRVPGQHDHSNSDDNHLSVMERWQQGSKSKRKPQVKPKRHERIPQSEPRRQIVEQQQQQQQQINNSQDQRAMGISLSTRVNQGTLPQHHDAQVKREPDDRFFTTVNRTED